MPLFCIYIILYIAAQRAALVDELLIGLEIALLLLLLAFSKFGKSVYSDTCGKVKGPGHKHLRTFFMNAP